MHDAANDAAIVRSLNTPYVRRQMGSDSARAATFTFAVCEPYAGEG
jgi:hypothetical protein